MGKQTILCIAIILMFYFERFNVISRLSFYFQSSVISLPIEIRRSEVDSHRLFGVYLL